MKKLLLFALLLPMIALAMPTRDFALDGESIQLLSVDSPVLNDVEVADFDSGEVFTWSDVAYQPIGKSPGIGLGEVLAEPMNSTKIANIRHRYEVGWQH